MQLEEIKEEVDKDMTDKEAKFDKNVVMEDDNEEEVSAHHKDKGTHICNEREKTSTKLELWLQR